MSEKDDGGPVHTNSKYVGLGISRRDWLAGLAMQGWSANSTGDNTESDEQTAEWAYRIADAMIVEGKK